MWPRWSRLPSRGVNNPSFSFKDLRSLVDDEENQEKIINPSPSELSIRRAAVFRRVRVASSALRAWRSPAGDPSPAPSSAEDNKIVLYYTSLRVVRKTFEDCRAVRSILRGFRVAVDERDVSMDSSFLSELNQILGNKKHHQQLPLPRVFIGGRYVGGFDEIQQLHETAELKRIVEGVPPAAVGVCDVCGGMRFVLCRTCSGSHKYYSEKKGFRTCNACNENGLVRCPDCCCGD